MAAQQPHDHGGEAACAAPEELSASLAGWRETAPLTAAGDRKALKKAPLALGKAAEVALLQTPKVAYPVRPAKPGGTVSYGGLLRFSVAEEGVYRVALGAAPWVDVVKDGVALPSVAHGHGPECSGIRKMVDYQLTQGDYVLQIAANGTETVTVMVAREP